MKRILLIVLVLGLSLTTYAGPAMVRPRSFEWIYTKPHTAPTMVPMSDVADFLAVYGLTVEDATPEGFLFFTAQIHGPAAGDIFIHVKDEATPEQVQAWFERLFYQFQALADDGEMHSLMSTSIPATLPNQYIGRAYGDWAYRYRNGYVFIMMCYDPAWCAIGTYQNNPPASYKLNLAIVWPDEN